MANYLRVRDASGRLIAHDGMKSMRFVSKHDIVVRHPVSNLSFMCSGEVPAAVSSNLIAVQSPRPVGLSFGEEPQGLGGEVHRLYSENHGSNKSNFTARVFCFARPSTTRQGGLEYELMTRLGIYRLILLIWG